MLLLILSVIDVSNAVLLASTATGSGKDSRLLRTCHFDGDNGTFTQDTHTIFKEMLEISESERKKGCEGKYLIFTCSPALQGKGINYSPCQGLGDRFRGLTTLVFLAFQYKRALLIDWINPTMEQYGLEPAYIDWRFPEECRGQMTDTIVVPHIPTEQRGYEIHEETPLRQDIVFNEFFENHLESHEKAIRISLNTAVHILFWHSKMRKSKGSAQKRLNSVLKYHEGCLSTLLFKPNKALQKEIALQLETMKSVFETKPVVFHWRTGDAFIRMNMTYNASDYLTRLSVLAHHFSPAPAERPRKLVLLTDNPGVKEVATKAGFHVFGHSPVHTIYEHSKYVSTAVLKTVAEMMLASKGSVFVSIDERNVDDTSTKFENISAYKKPYRISGFLNIIQELAAVQDGNISSYHADFFVNGTALDMESVHLCQRENLQRVDNDISCETLPSMWDV